MVLRYVFAVVVSVLLLVPISALADVKQALIIGNDAYSGSPLKNPGNDARALASTLKKLDFKVDLLINKSAADMKQALDKFARETAQNNAVGLVYFSGHGVQLRDRNLALGVDADMENDLRERSINIQEFLIKMDASNTTNIVIIDACREYLPPNKEFLSNREARNGLQPLDPSTGTLIAFSTLPGKVAFDGGSHEKNGVYAKALLKYLGSPGLPVETIFKNVRRDVAKETNGKQIPMELSLLTRDFYFKPASQGYFDKAAKQESVVVGKEESITLSDDRPIKLLYGLTDLYAVLAKIRAIDKAGRSIFSPGVIENLPELVLSANEIFQKISGQQFTANELQEMSKNVISVGAYFSEIPPFIKDYFNVQQGGVVAREVQPTGIAYRAGMRDGDILIGVNKKQIRSMLDLQNIADTLHPGEIVQATVIRAGNTLTLSATVERTSVEDLILIASTVSANNGNYGRSRNMLQSLSASRNGNANARLAIFDWNGWGRPLSFPDYKSAFELSKLAMEQGSELGKIRVSLAYSMGKGVNKDYAISNQIRMEAAKQGLAWGAAGVGVSYLLGTGMPKDYQQARYFLEGAAMLGSIDGIVGMAHIFENGLGVTQNKAEAINWYQRALQVDQSDTTKTLVNSKIARLSGQQPPEPDPVQLIGNVIKLLSK